jgi:hypothetical protein
VTDEVMTQRDLQKSPAGQNFISKWTWPLNENDKGKYPRFKRTNTIEEYFFVRVVEGDKLLGIGAIRIHWDGDGDFVLDTSMEMTKVVADYHYTMDPHKAHDVEGLIKTKLSGHLILRLSTGRYGRNMMPPAIEAHPHHHDHHHDHGDYGRCEHQHPFHRGHDDRGYDYRNHHYEGKPCENRPNPPKNGPYGGVYNAYDDIDHTRRNHIHSGY